MVKDLHVNNFVIGRRLVDEIRVPSFWEMNMQCDISWYFLKVKGNLINYEFRICLFYKTYWIIHPQNLI